MKQAQNIATGDSSVFSGSPYLHNIDLDLAGGTPPARLKRAELERFIKTAFPGAGAESAKEATLDALDYYAKLAEFYGALFAKDTIAVGADPCGPPLSAKDIAGLPDAPVVLSVLDEGIPFLHHCTRSAKGRSRVVSLWMQNARGTTQAVPFGKNIGHDTIQTLLDSKVDEEICYRRAGAIDPSLMTPQRLSEYSTHGAAVLGIAAGDKEDNHLLMGVNFPPAAVKDTSGSLLPFFVLLGICHCLERTQALSQQLAKAAPKRFANVTIPLVFNLSYGVLAGPKDGSGILENVMEQLSQLAPGCLPGIGKISFVVPMGNGKQTQTSALLSKGAKSAVQLRLPPEDRTPSYVELWQCGTSASKPQTQSFTLKLTPPQGKTACEIPLAPFETQTTYTFDCGAHLRIYTSLREHNGVYREMVMLAFPPTWARARKNYSRPGDWKIELVSATQSQVQIYVQRDESLFGLESGGRQSRLHHKDYVRLGPDGRLLNEDPPQQSSPITRMRTVSAFANAPSVKRVGGTVKKFGQHAYYSALGDAAQSRPIDGDHKEFSDDSRNTAGVIVRGVRSGCYERLSGTSLAAPKVALGIARGDIPP